MREEKRSKDSMAKLFLMRHGKSVWNELGLWTGWRDVELNEIGIAEAQRAGEVLRDHEIHRAYVSDLTRAKQTLLEIQKVLELEHLIVQSNAALNERNYGIYTGKNKWEIKNEIGEDKFQALRRGWDVSIPEGETLKDVFMRVIPYYEDQIIANLRDSKNVLVVAHGNTLRALIKHIEKLDDEAVADIEVGTGEIHSYEFNDLGIMTKKEVLAHNEKIGKI